MQSLSLWERNSFLDYDYAIIGGGIVGMSTALSLREHAPNARIIVLERGLLPSGASTKNAGFSCFGSITELLEDWEAMGKEKALELVKLRWEGLQKLKSRVGAEGLGYKPCGGYEVIREAENYALDYLDEMNAWLAPLFDEPVFSLSNDNISSFGFPEDKVQALIKNGYEGQVDTGKMMRSLQQLCQEHHITLWTGAKVTQLEEETGQVKVYVEDPVQQELLPLSVKHVAVCTNAFSQKLLPEQELKPGRGLVLVTKPLDKVPYHGVFHYDKGYFYFRDAGDRIILGGGRNLAIEEEATEEFGENSKIKERLLQDLQEWVSGGVSVEVDFSWSGIMAFGPNKFPVMEKVSEHIVAGIRLGGMGVAIGSALGQRLADLLME